MRKYEYLYIFNPQEEKTKKAIEEVNDHYNKMGVRILKEAEMGKRQLAYVINKNTEGFYYMTQIEIDDFTRLQEFETDLKLNKKVIRFMKVRI